MPALLHLKLRLPDLLNLKLMLPDLLTQPFRILPQGNLLLKKLRLLQNSLYLSNIGLILKSDFKRTAGGSAVLFVGFSQTVSRG